MELNEKTVQKALDWLDSLVGNSNDSDIAMFTYQLLGILYDTCEELTEENKAISERHIIQLNAAIKLDKQVQWLAQENERLHASCTELERKCASLTEENERLRTEAENQSVLWRQHFESIYESGKETFKADTVREMLQRIKEDAISVSLLSNPPKFMLEIREDALDQIAKEMLEGNDGRKDLE